MTWPKHNYGLRGVALKVAQSYCAKFPDAMITSGKRDAHDQARAMAQNEYRVRGWILETYADSKAKRAVVFAVEKYRSENVQLLLIGLEAAILNALLSLTPDELSAISLHLSGDAFDASTEPSAAKDAFLETEAKKYPYAKFLPKEGGIVKRHWQVRPHA